MAAVTNNGVLNAIQRLMQDRVSKYRRWSVKAQRKAGMHMTEQCAHDRTLYLNQELDLHMISLGKAIGLIEEEIDCRCTPETATYDAYTCLRCRIAHELRSSAGLLEGSL